NFLTLPNATIRTGDFSLTGTNIYDPGSGASNGTGRTVFPGDKIPTNLISPVAQAMLGYLPLPQTAATANNYFSEPEYNTVFQKVDGKVNWNVNNKLAVYSRVGFSPSHETASGYYPGALNPLSLGGAGTGNIFTISLGATYTLSPTLIM